jgi:hypothetical protein
MSNKVPFKAQAMMRDLAVRLKNRTKDLSAAEESVGGKYAFIRISTDYERSDESGKVDGLGLTQRVYSPHKCELVQEDAATADAATLNLRAQIMAEVSKLGTKVCVLEGPAVQDETDFASAFALAVKVAEIKSDDIHPLTQQM